MNQSTVIGLLGGAIVLIGMLIMAPVNAGAFFNIPGLIVVLGGTFAATCISRPFRDVSRLLRTLPGLFREDAGSIETDVAQLLQFATRYRHGNLQAAERELANIENPFLHAGLRRVIDRGTLEDLRNSMQWRISGLRSREQGRVQILQTMSVFAPAFGMLGTLFGLVQMLSGIGTSGLDEIGGTMAFAMITTVYGIVASNLFFKPLAIKMERRTVQRLMHLNALMEGVMQVYEKRHPTLIRESLEGFFAHQASPIVAPGALELVRI